MKDWYGYRRQIRSERKLAGKGRIMAQVYYVGTRANGRCTVTRVDGDQTTDLPQRLDLWNHSPTGFEWGYGGSGPAQLALALLANVLRNDEQASAMHNTFTWDIVAKLPKEGWRLWAREILAWVDEHDQARADRHHDLIVGGGGIDLAAPELEDPADGN